MQARKEWQDIPKVKKGKTYNQDYSIQQGTHSGSTGKSKALQISKSKENSTQPSQLYNKCQRNFSREETQEKDLQKQRKINKINGNRIIHINNYLKCK